MAPFYLLSYLHHVAPNSHCRERKYSLAHIFKYAQHPVDQNLLIICLCIWEHPAFEAEGSLSSVISCSVSPSAFFFYSQRHVSGLSQRCDFGQNLLGSSRACSPPSWFRHVSVAQACYPSTQEHQSLGTQTHKLQKVNGHGRQKVHSWTSCVFDQLSLLSQGPQHKGKEGGGCSLMQSPVRPLCFASSNLIQAEHSMWASEGIKLASKWEENWGDEEGSR